MSWIKTVMKSLVVLPFLSLLPACSDSPENKPMPPDTFEIRILDETGRVVYKGKGDVHYYGGTEVALSNPVPEIPIPDSLNFMVIFIDFNMQGELLHAGLYQRYYSLAEDFGFASASGFLRFEPVGTSATEVSFSSAMYSDSDHGMNPHPLWGDKILVTCRFTINK
jgi:hypothetical protein